MLFQGMQIVTKLVSGHNVIEVDVFVGNDMIGIIFSWFEAVDSRFFVQNFEGCNCTIWICMAGFVVVDVVPGHANHYKVGEWSQYD